VLIVRAAIACLVARMNLLMLGPPGVGKSQLAAQVCNALGGRYFEYLMTRYTTPDELFGPFSLTEIQRDVYKRITASRLPEADIVFLDEVFKGNSAICNTLLPIMNERKWHDEGKVKPVNITSIFSASNELPEGKELAAMHDRFLVRLYKRDVEDDGSLSVLLDEALPPMSATLTHADIATMRAASDPSVCKLAPEVNAALVAIYRKARKAGIEISPRRWIQAARLLRADTVINGGTVVTTANLTLLPCTMWTTTDQIARCEEIVHEFAASWVRDVQDIGATLDEQVATINRVLSDKSSERAQKGAALCGVVDVLEIVKKKTEALAAEAGDDKQRLSGRIVTIKKAAVDAMKGVL
jgi:MoxR-like ATPase